MRRHIEFINSNTDLTSQARLLLAYNEAVLLAMKRAFGEEYPVNALPEKASNQSVIDLCES